MTGTGGPAGRVWRTLLVAAVAGSLLVGPPARVVRTSAVTGNTGATTGRTQFLLASAGSDGVPAPTGGGRPALSATGGQTAFVSGSALAVTASVPQTPTEGTSQANRVYVHGRLTGDTSLLSDAGAGDAAAPDISADGRLVAYQFDSNRGGSQIDVVDRRSTGKGGLDAPGNLVSKQVTDNPGDPHFQRVLSCQRDGDDSGVTETRCGPRLSSDGSTLAYPARLSPLSPSLLVTSGAGDDGDGDIVGNVIDFVPPGEMAYGGPENDTLSTTLTFVNDGAAPIRFVGPPSLTGPFRLTSLSCGDGQVTSFGTLGPGRACTVVITFDSADSCPENGRLNVLSGDLVTDATTPDGQSSRELVVTCPPYQETDTESVHQRRLTAADPITSSPGTPTSGQPPPPADDCPAVPNGLPLVAAPQATDDNQGNDLVDLGAVEIGRPVIEWTTVSGVGAMDLVSPDCSVRLVDPAVVHPAGPLPEDQPPACRLGQYLGGESSAGACTGYFVVRPTGLATRSVLVTVGPDYDTGQWRSTYLSVTGVRNVVVTRRGPDFAVRGTVASVDGVGAVIPGAGEPSLSATGRYLAFSAPVPIGRPGQQTGDTTQVWRHDTDRVGDRRFLPGATDLVSCLPGSGCALPVSAGSPAMSGDATRIAFATGSTANAPGQVYVRKTLAGSTFLVSSTGGAGVVAGDLPSGDPAISLDGTTAAFTSPARNLLAAPTTGESANLYLVDLGPGDTGIGLIGPGGAALPDGAGAGAPTLDATGRVVAFLSDAPFTAGAPHDVDSTFTFERFGQLQVTPRGIGFGRIVAGLPGQARTVTVANSGPGPTTITGVAVTGPFQLLTNTCAGAALRRGQTCVLVVRFTPKSTGRAVGLLTVSTADDGELVQRFPVGLTAEVVAPTSPLLTISPDVTSGGQVVRATGVAFAPGTAVVLSWDHGLGTANVTPDSTGRFVADLVIFPDDMLGPRNLLATGPTGTVVAARPLLVDASPQEPPFHH